MAVVSKFQTNFYHSSSQL